MSHSDAWILPNLGVYASKDIAAIDTACLDASDRAQAVPGSRPYDEGLQGEPWKAGNEKFTYIKRTPLSQWISVNAAVRMGLGSADYELIEATPGPRERYVQPKFREHPPGYYTRKAFSIHKPRFEPECYLDVERVTMKEIVGRPKTNSSRG